MDSFGRKPTVFISSTCYDLKQIRDDLKKIIEKDLGLEALLSEYKSFPLDPSLGTVENCLRAVQERADIFVLIVGTRYGAITDSGKSVTNLEYLRAKEKGIPIYAFVDKKIKNNIPLWRDNPSMDFSSSVDTPELFNFVDELMSIDNVWVHEFEFASEISERLKYQFAYLFYDSLKIRKKIKSNNLSNKVLQTSPDALQIVLEKPLGWEYRFFSQLLSDNIDSCKELKRDVEYQIFLEFNSSINDYSDLFYWITEKNDQVLRIVNALSSLINNAFKTAIGKPGEPSDLDFLVYIVNKISDVYKKIIQWEVDLGSTTVPEDAEKLVLSFSNISHSIIADIERFENELREEFNKIPSSIQEGEEFRLNITLKLNEPDFTEFHYELEKLKRKINL